MNNEPLNHCNLWLHLGEVVENTQYIQETLFYDDPRHHGEIRIFLSSQDLHSYLKSKVGPDLLQDEITPEYWHLCFRNKRLVNKAVCEFLLEQSRFSGIGNYMRSEILYRCRIDPFRTLGSLSDKEIELLRYHSLKIVREIYEARGASLYTYFEMDGSKGNFQVVIYGQEFDPEGNPITNASDKKKRTVWWVPALQN